MAKVRLTKAGCDDDVCLDTGCGVTLIDRVWLTKLLSNAILAKMASPLRVQGVGFLQHETSEYLVTPCYFPGIDKHGNKVLACVRREIHIVDGLRAKMLIGNDFIGLEGITIDVAREKAYITSCKTSITVTARQCGQFIRRKVHTVSAITISPHSKELVLISRNLSLPEDCDYMFEPTNQANVVLFTHLVNSRVKAVLAKNDSDRHVEIPRKFRLGAITELTYKNCFQADIDLEYASTATSSTQGWQEKVFHIAASADHPQISPTVLQGPEERLPNGVTVYGSVLERQTLSNLVNDFPTLLQDKEFIDVSELEWMKLPLKSDWEERINSKGAKVYPLGLKDKEVVDRTFDELHRQGRLMWTTQPTPFSYPVFVVWKDVPSEKRKGRAVVDIWGLNDLLIRDAYPAPL